MQHHFAAKGEIPTKKVKPSAHKRKPTKNQSVITIQIGAQSAPYKTNAASPRCQRRKTNNEIYTKRSQAKAYKKTTQHHLADFYFIGNKIHRIPNQYGYEDSRTFFLLNQSL
jgi:hypothetical protein